MCECRSQTNLFYMELPALSLAIGFCKAQQRDVTNIAALGFAAPRAVVCGVRDLWKRATLGAYEIGCLRLPPANTRVCDACSACSSQPQCNVACGSGETVDCFGVILRSAKEQTQYVLTGRPRRVRFIDRILRANMQLLLVAYILRALGSCAPLPSRGTKQGRLVITRYGTLVGNHPAEVLMCCSKIYLCRLLLSGYVALPHNHVMFNNQSNR